MVQSGHAWQHREHFHSRRVAVILIVALVIAVAGCSSSKTKEPGEGTEGASGLGEKGTGDSSLQQLQQGTLGSHSQGPLSNIHFAFNDYTILPQDGSILQSHARWLSANPKTRVQIEGHCDERGSEEYNLGLGAKRAQAAKDYLVTLGVSGSRISTITYGKELPLCTEHEESCWSQNRRDHFVVTQ